MGQHVRRARRARGFSTLDAFAARTGVSVRTISDLERGARSSFRPETLGAVEDALGWEPESMETILKGGRPTQKHDEDLAAILDRWPDIHAAGRRAVRALAESFAAPNP